MIKDGLDTVLGTVRGNLAGDVYRNNCVMDDVLGV